MAIENFNLRNIVDLLHKNPQGAITDWKDINSIIQYLISAGIWDDGNGAPSNSYGLNGQYYNDLVLGDVYRKVNNAWVLVGNLNGMGAQGPQGPQGIAGAQGIGMTPIDITVAAAQALVAGSTVVPGAWYNITDSSQAIDPTDRILVQGTAVDAFDQVAVYVDNVNNQRNEIQYILDDVPTDLVIFRKDNKGNQIWDSSGYGTIISYPWGAVNNNSNIVLGGLAANTWGTNVLVYNIFKGDCNLIGGGFNYGVYCSNNIVGFTASIIAASDNINIVNNIIGNASSVTCSKRVENCTIGENCTIDDGGFNLIGCTFPSGMTFTATQDYTNVNFGQCKKIKTITNADSIYSTLVDDYTILGDCSGGAIEVDLAASVFYGNVVNIKKTDASVNTIRISSTGGANIDGAASYDLTALNESISVQFDGTNWWVI